MFLLKIFYFLKGYVIIEIENGNFARFVNICTARGIRLWNISRGRASVWESDFKKIRPAARKAGVRIKIKKKCGFCRRYFSRGGWFAFACAAVFALLLLISTQYVWDITVEGCDEETARLVYGQAERIGLCRGVRKSSLPEGNVMRDEILYNVDGINWVWVYLEGTHARIAVSEDIPAPVLEDDTTPCNISARCDGILSFVSAKGGRAVLSKGDRVSAGDIVISGAMPGGERVPPYETAAEGEVYAQTVHTKSCDYPLYKTYTNDTGTELTRYSVRLFELELPLWSAKQLDFEEYRTEVNTPPAGICSYRYIETETVREPISVDTAVYEATEILYEQIAKELAPGSSKLDERVISEKISDNTIRVTLSMSFTENIGVKTPIESWQIEELNE